MIRRVVAAIAVTLLGAATACSLLIDAKGLTATDADASAYATDADTNAVAPARDAAPAVDAKEAGGDGGSGCPGAAGPTAIPVGDAGFCMDRTEVTVGDYRAFLAARAGDTSGQPAICEWNVSFVPTYGMPGAERDDRPISWVDWCDAVAYCSWAGKRLCGAIGGGPGAAADWVDATKNEWFYACSRRDDGLHEYPYGNDYEPSRCIGLDWFDGGQDGLLPVERAAQCIGGYPDLIGLSGNVREWDNACEPQNTDAGSVRCRVRGGAYYDNAGALKCRAGDPPIPRSETNVGVGIRCCSG